MPTRIIKFLLLYLALLVCGHKAYCQPYYFTHYQVEDGLSNNAVLCSLQDHQGFMWFGTRDGLNRFDGLSFKIFRTDPADPHSIGSNGVLSICEDERNQIWVGTEKGIFSYDGKTERFSQLHVAGNRAIRNVRVTGGNVWYISLYTLYRYNMASQVLKKFRIGKEVTSYCLTKDNTLWMATATGTIARYDSIQENFTEYNLFARSPSAISTWIESIFDTGTGWLLVGTSNQGLKSFDIRCATYKDILTLNTDQTDLIVRQIIATRPNEYWIATQSGIFILDLPSGRFRHLVRDQNDPYSLSDNIVHTLCRDKEGGIWAGTYFGGINYYPKQHILFKKYFPRTGINSISGNAVREICHDRWGKLWIGTEDAGLDKFDPATDHFETFHTGSPQQSISYSNIHGLLVDGEKVWVGTYLHGLDVLDAKTGRKTKHYNTRNSSLGSNFIYSLYKTKKDTLIVATDKGLYKYLPQEDNFALITQVPKVFYRALYEDRDGTLWAGTYGDGVFCFNTEKGIYKQFSFQPNNRAGLLSNLINQIFEDSGGTMWFATEGGLCRYDAANDRFEGFTTAAGFPSNVTYSILEDARKNLWVSTSRGLACFSPTTGKVRVYTKSHGLLTDQFNYNSKYKDARGRMYFGSVKGLITFNPDSIENNLFAPPVFLTGFQVHNKELPIDEKDSPLKTSVTAAKSITLTYAQSTFSLDFAALSYTAPTMNRYAYKMDGLDNEWTHLQTNRKVYFTELNPGTYTFQVKALNDDTGSYGKPAVLTIRILPPLWRTWWAYALYAGALGLLAYLVIRHFSNRAKEKNRRVLEKMEYEKERENYRDKMEFFTNVAHEIRTPLTLIRGPMENIMERADEIPAIRNSLEIMNRNTDRLLHLSNQLLDFRKTEMNGFRLSFSKENLGELLLDHYANFKSVAAQKGVDLIIDFPKFFWAYIDAEAFNKIISNLWDNAVKYAATKALISLKGTDENSDTYQLLFANDGYLIPPDSKETIFKSFYRARETAKQPGTGIGLTLARSLAEMHGGSLTLDSGNTEMNVFILTLPVLPRQT
ncbi:MAG: histidine kinase [Williamsia sp.]|nr:histidine kinase [Williamsia sp.]